MWPVEIGCLISICVSSVICVLEPLKSMFIVFLTSSSVDCWLMSLSLKNIFKLLIPCLECALQMMSKWVKVAQSYPALCDPLWPHGLYSSWNSSGQNTGVDSLSLLQGALSNPGIEPRSPALQAILYQLSHKGSPRILEWVAYLFSSRSSRPRYQTRVFCIAGGFFTNWAIREVLPSPLICGF